ncbi:hypothetical protein BGZ60DRAFT_533895 [Tricladium varicosporioides]|nr:hypothetical protein BGZ60DRAFT_533895 [Hymenoscyphus varicosporioides]
MRSSLYIIGSILLTMVIALPTPADFARSLTNNLVQLEREIIKRGTDWSFLDAASEPEPRAAEAGTAGVAWFIGGGKP